MPRSAIVKPSPRLFSGLAKVLGTPANKPGPTGTPPDVQAKDWPGNPWGPAPSPWGPAPNPWGPAPNPWAPSSYAASQVSMLANQLQGASQTLSGAMDARQNQVSWLGGLFDPAMWSMRRASWALDSAQSATSSAQMDLNGQGGWSSGGPQDASSRLSQAQSHLADADRSLYAAQVHLAQSNPYGGYDNTSYLVGSARQGVEAGYQEAGYALNLLGSGYNSGPYASRSIAAKSTQETSAHTAGAAPTAAAIFAQALGPTPKN